MLAFCPFVGPFTLLLCASASSETYVALSALYLVLCRASPVTLSFTSLRPFVSPFSSIYVCSVTPP